MNQLIVKTSKMQLILAVVLGLFFVPAGLGLLIRGIVSGFKMNSMMIGFLLLVTFAFVIWLVLRGRSRSVKDFSAEGLTRNDGKMFPWTGLNRVIYQYRINDAMRNKRMWRTEIHFNDGNVAWLIPSKVVNLQEVMDFVAGLPCEKSEVRVGGAN